MDEDVLPRLQNRLWAAFQQLNHEYRKKQISFNACIRKAYLACTREGLSPESAEALVVHWGLKLKWLRPYRQTGRQVRWRFEGVTPTKPPSTVPASQPISEALWRAEIAKLVADLKGKAPRTTAKQARFTVRASWLRAELARPKWNKPDLAGFGGPHHKTTQKVLDGLPVRDGVLQKIAIALSAWEGAKEVSVIEISRK
jgi:hypothetical protein